MSRTPLPSRRTLWKKRWKRPSRPPTRIRPAGNRPIMSPIPTSTPVVRAPTRTRGGTAALPVPDRFTERGEPPLVTLTGPVPPGAVEVSGGRVLVRIATEAGTVTSEVRDPPHPPANKPLVTVSVGPDAKPRVEVTGGKAQDSASSTEPAAGLTPPANHPFPMPSPLRPERWPAFFRARKGRVAGASGRPRPVFSHRRPLP